MERDGLKGRQTVGVASVILNDSYNAASVQDSDGMELGWFHPSAQFGMNPRRIDYDDVKANAALYAEAHNVANRTGMWPADMEARIKELEGALDDFLLWADIRDTGSIQAIRVRDCARALLNK